MRLLLAALLLAPAALAQAPADSSRVIGRVVDDGTGDPIAYAQVWREGEAPALTDPDGWFEIALPVGVSRLRVRFVGYEVAEVDVDVAAPGWVVFREVRMTVDLDPCPPLCGPPPVLARGVYAARVAAPRFGWRCVETAEGQTVAVAQ